MGLSLGEYSALCHAGAFSFAAGVRLTRARGEAMQAASLRAPTGMAAVLGVKEAAVRELLNAVNAEIGTESVFIANYLSSNNFTVAGTMEGCQLVKKMGKSHGVKLVRQLPVSGAFHTKYMAPASAALREALDETDICAPRIPVISNVTGAPHSAAAICENLVRQLTEPVLWSASISYVLSTGTQFCAYDIGPGTVSSDLLKKIDVKSSETVIDIILVPTL
jgi:[acyl-carrier-protein] S-malonyltransferase